MESYPEHLLPTKDAAILGQEEIKNKKVARWHNPEKKGSIFDQDGNINADLIDYHRYPKFSINLIPPSKCHDLKILLLDKDLEDYWNPDDIVPNVENSDFKVVNKREVFEFKTNDITSAELPYLINKDTYILSIDIVHKPLMANYAHCEFKLIPSHPNASKELTDLTSKTAYHRLLISNLRKLMEKHCTRCKS